MILLEILAQCHLIFVTYLPSFSLLSFENASLRLPTRTLSSTEQDRSVGHHCNLQGKSYTCVSFPPVHTTSVSHCCQLLPRIYPCSNSHSVVPARLIWDHFSLCKALQIREKVDGEQTFRNTTVSKVFVLQVAWQGHLNCFWLDIELQCFLLMHKGIRLIERIAPGHSDRNNAFFSPRLPVQGRVKETFGILQNVLY